MSTSKGAGGLGPKPGPVKKDPAPSTAKNAPAPVVDQKTPVEPAEAKDRGLSVVVPRYGLAPNAPAHPALPRQRFDPRSGKNDKGDKRGGSSLPNDRAGDESLEPDAFAAMSVMQKAEHLMILLAKKRASADRSLVIGDVAERLIAIEDPDAVKKVLLAMGDFGRIVDIYPLEVMIAVLDRRPDLLRHVEIRPFIRNKPELETRTFEVEQPIVIKHPVAIKMRAFAIDGGAAPGYCLQPGSHPDEYQLEFGDAGTFTVLFRADLHQDSVIERLTLQVVDAPGNA